jgi:hypothetical protein
VAVSGESAPRPVPGPRPGTPGGSFDAAAFTARIDALLASDATGDEEARLLEDAHRIINDALEGR